MPLDWEQLKQRFTKRSSTQETASVQEPVTQDPTKAPAKEPAKATAMRSFMEGMKNGAMDIKAVLGDGNYKLFLKQLIVLLLAFLGVRFLMGKLAVQKEQIVDKISALSIQQANEEDYLANKERLLRLEPLFPDLAKKNEWLLQTLMRIFEDHKIQANIDGNAAENVGTDYTTVAQTVTLQQGFFPLGKFLADVENGENFLRISEISISKLSEPSMLGENAVSVKFNTLFPKEKYAKRLFKDYAEQMAQIAAQKEPAAKKNNAPAQQPQGEAKPTATPQDAQPTELSKEDAPTKQPEAAPEGGAQ